MSRYPDELGEWWNGFPGSDAAAWAAPSARSADAVAPAEKGIRGAFSRRAVKHGVVVAPGKRERAKRDEASEWRRQTIAAIRAPSLKSGVITLGSGFGGAMLETCGSAGKGLMTKEGVPSRMIES